MLLLLSRLSDSLNRRAAFVLPTLARLTFAAVLLQYFWASAVTKLGDGVLGIFRPSVNAYAQIYPRALEAAGYDASQLGLFPWAVVVGGTIAEFVLPLLIVLGLLTRLAALGMIGFVVVQSLTDIIGHAADPVTIGAWFDRLSGSLIMDQRTLWVMVLLILVMRGAGPLSFDRILFRNVP
ncbi:DoxX family membrane protein [Flavimaricola marinus]|uniref:DoxX n=1 Tax=Flavimaricola marinus TaxID=1819565 RepID=A0A238LIU6_9RHOB|nr:DoxX family membrane protein [Flavimaricola marinus]SMY09473.1 DoxX [Flavimaricola marinus]